MLKATKFPKSGYEVVIRQGLPVKGEGVVDSDNVVGNSVLIRA